MIDYTVEEFVSYLNDTYGFTESWPKQLEVSPATYGNICDRLIKEKMNNSNEWYGFVWTIKLYVGNNGGVMFKDIELILVGKEND